MALLECALVHHTGSMIRFTTSQLDQLPARDRNVKVLLPDGHVIAGRFHRHTQNPYVAGRDVVHYIKARIAFGEKRESLIEVPDHGVWVLYGETGDASEAADDALAVAQGFLPSSADRQAIEMLAMEEATAHLEDNGYTVEDVHKWSPYDLHCHKSKEVWHVEVKGTQGCEREVIVTYGEVEFARANAGTMALYVLSNIKLTAGKASGGTGWIWKPWDVDAGELRAISYRYATPE